MCAKKRSDLKHKMQDRCTFCGGVLEKRDCYHVVSELIGRFIYPGPCAYCPRCRKESSLNKLNNDTEKLWVAASRQEERMLRKNYPLGKYEYYTEDEVVALELQANLKPDYKNFYRGVYHITEKGKTLYLKKSYEIFSDPNAESEFIFNITRADDWGRKRDNSDQLRRFFPPDRSYYLSEKEAEEMAQNSPFWFDKAHLDYFTHNMFYKGSRIYLARSCQEYRRIYHGLFDIAEEAELEADMPLESEVANEPITPSPTLEATPRV